MRLVALALAALLVAACGSSSSRPQPRDTTLVLDFTPNPVHTGIYAALAQHLDQDAGFRLHLVAPTASTDSIKLLETGRTDFAILDIHDLAIARERGQDVVGIMAIVERPLAAVLAAPNIGRPRQLPGQTVGITGVPSDTAVLDSIVSGDGGDPRRLKTITIGFNAVPDLLSGKVEAAVGFWNDEGVTLTHRRPGFHVFRVDRYGAPAYPELVVCATSAALRRDPGRASALVRVLTRGYQLTLFDPKRSAAELEHLVPGLDPALVTQQLGALLPAFRAPDGQVGELDPAMLRRWAAWEARFGIVRRPPDVQAAFDTSLVTNVADSRAIRERGTTRSNPA
ncbi:MAG TPA: ABC transporter substrate-binding protein [Solirubrobacteraceae bacterium]|nr:ABC transporter substrate-binding protein [Solirubrobacteraceae bacterium]